MSFELAGWLEAVERSIEAHRVGSGQRYARTRLAGPGEKEAAPNPYGCADAANLLYTIGRFPSRPAERADWVEGLRGFQDPHSGLFREATHHEIHTTAHCLGALELFDSGPHHPLTALAGFAEPSALERFLEELDWRKDPWHASHRGAGLYAARHMAGEALPEWIARYFGWLDREADPDTGLWRRGCIEGFPALGGDTRFPHLAGTFHYLFNFEHARRPLPHAARLVDTCLEIGASDPFPLGRMVGFAEIDWVYCLSRAVRRSGHRLGEARAALLGFAERYVPFLLARDPASDPDLDDLHRLFGAVCALAELQAVLPGQLRSPRPLRLVLDRRPFI